MSQLSIFDVLEPPAPIGDMIKFDRDWKWQDEKPTADLNENGILIGSAKYHFFVPNPKRGWLVLTRLQ